MKWFWHRSRMERDMDEELRFHIDSYASDLIKQGVAEEEAFRRARVAFGAVEARKEECRESLGLRLWDELRSDLRGGFRILRQSPVFTAVAVISLALGIGANTAIFSLADEVLMRTMAVPHSDRLRLFTWAHGPKAHLGPAWGSFGRNDQGEMTGTPFPYPLFREMQRTNQLMEDLAGFKDLNGAVSANVNGEAEGVDALMVSGNFYQALGARVQAGRAIRPLDDLPAASPVAVISDAYWTRRFGRSANALGKTISLNRVPLTIVGVNTPEFKGAKAGGTPEVFFPLSLQPQVIPNPRGSLLTQNSFWWVVVTGRLKPGITDQMATATLTTAFHNAFHATIPEKKDQDIPRFYLGPGDRGLDQMQTHFKKPLYLLLAVAGLVLLIACANLANLLLARAAVRQREISLRLAMGAGRGRIMRQILTESMLLAVLGGAAGILLGYAVRDFIPGLFDDPWRSGSGIHPQMDWRVFAFAFSTTIATGLLFGLGPAWRSTRADANAALKETSRMSTGHSKALFGKVLVVFQVALSLLLVVGAGLFVRTLLNLRSAPTGINPEHIVLFQVFPPQAHYSSEQRIRLFQRITEGLAAVPGAQKVTSSSEPLLAQSSEDGCFRPLGRPAGTSQQDSAWMNSVGADFFETFGIPILSGRTLTLHDNQRGPKAAVINETMARIFFPKINAVGQTITTCDDKPQLLQVVGISKDAKYDGIRGEVPPTIYLPYAQVDDLDRMTFEIKTAASLASVVPKIRAAVKAVDKDLPVLDVRTQTEQIDALLAQERVFATLTSGFGLLALVLASVGIYGVMAYTVSRRTNEIGIRMALGAAATTVLKMVLSETAILALIGIMAGLGGALAATRVLTSMLFGVKATDAGTFCAGAGLLLLVALAAALIPAWRAARVEPMTALRHE